MARIKRAITARPPTTPPAMAPVGVDFVSPVASDVESGVEVATEVAADVGGKGLEVEVGGGVVEIDGLALMGVPTAETKEVDETVSVVESPAG